jgi:hypothetical protein
VASSYFTRSDYGNMSHTTFARDNSYPLGAGGYRPRSYSARTRPNFVGGSPSSRPGVQGRSIRQARSIDNRMYNITRSGTWIGSRSRRDFSRIGWNIDRAISGSATSMRWSTNRRAAAPISKTLTGAQRIQAIGRAGDRLLSGMWHLPKKTKIAHSRRNKSKFYTHYFDY